MVAVAFPSKRFQQEHLERDVAAKHESLPGSPGTTCVLSISLFTLHTSFLTWLSPKCLVDIFVLGDTHGHVRGADSAVLLRWAGKQRWECWLVESQKRPANVLLSNLQTMALAFF